MTCIVGIVHKGKVIIGGDSAGVSGYHLCTRKDKKVFVNEGFAMGFTTSFRMGQLLAFGFKPPVPDPKADLMRFMVNEFVNAVRNCLKEGGYATKHSEAEKGGDFLVGYKGRLFQISSDYQVGEVVCGFDSIGCGQEFAIGALHATPGIEPRKRVRLALEVAEKCSAGVRGPFHIVTVER